MHKIKGAALIVLIIAAMIFATLPSLFHYLMQLTADGL